MESIGQYIRREREFRKITIAEVAEATRISSGALRAIEDDAFDELPGIIFIRGYLKAYAEHIGLDATDLLLRYEQWLKSVEEEDGKSHVNSRRPWHWKRKYLWITLIVAGIMGLAFMLSRM